MNRDLHELVGTKEYEKLFASIDPPALVRGATIAKGAEEVTYKRGTLMAKSSTTGKLSILGTTAGSGDTLAADCVLTDDVTVGTAEDENVTVYITGDFNLEAVIVKDGYTITEGDKDELRKKGIIFGTVMNP